MDSEPKDLLTPIFTGGILNTNFFNGRLLSAEDMQREQQANRDQHQQLGQLIGEGVAYGLEVRQKKGVVSLDGKPAGVVTVNAGMAVNRAGQVLCLKENIELALVPKADKAAEAAGLFAPCEALPTAEFSTGTGIYILVISPVSGYEGTAQVSGLGAELSGRGGCRRRDTVEGVQFRMVRVSFDTVIGISPQTGDEITRLEGEIAAGIAEEKNLFKLRNLLAHVSFGTEQLAASVSDCVSHERGRAFLNNYSLVEKLRAMERPVLTNCDLPLGLIYWSKERIGFIDLWAVRRRISAYPFLYGPLVSSRALAEAEAVFLQFQHVIAEIAESADDDLHYVDATWFTHLPPAGILPIDSSYLANYLRESESELSNSIANRRGIDPTRFFSMLAPSEPAFIEGAALDAILHGSLQFLPTRVSLDKELVWVYFVRENVQKLTGIGVAQPCLLFTRGEVPSYAQPRLDLSRFDFCNYSSV